MGRRWGFLVFIIGAIFAPASASAVNYGVVSDGDWEAPATWTPFGGPPMAADNVYIGTGFPDLAIVPAAVQMNSDVAANLVSIGHGSLDLNGHELTANSLLLDSESGIASVIKSNGRVELDLLLLFGGSTFAIDANDNLTTSVSVDGVGSAFHLNRSVTLQQGVAINDGSIATSTGMLTALGYGVQLTAATFNAGADIVTPSSFYGTGITNGGVLNLNGHSLIAGVLYLGSGTFQVIGGSATLNRGLNGNVQLGSIVANSGNSFTIESADSISEKIQVSGIGTNILLNRDLAISDVAVIQDFGTLDLNGRTLSSAESISLSNGGILKGSGAIQGQLNNASGVITLGASIGLLSVEGFLEQQSGGTLEVKLAGNDNSNPQLLEYDQLVVSGTASFTGKLSVSLVSSFSPIEGDLFPIVTASNGLQFSFDSVLLPTLSSGLAWHLDESNPQALILRVVPASLPGDYNQNGTVDAADYVVWRDSFGFAVQSSQADGDGNGEVGLEDYDFWRSRFGATTGIGSTVSLGGIAVPEPTFAAFGLIALSGFGRWRMSGSFHPLPSHRRE